MPYEIFCDLSILNVYFFCFTYNVFHIIFSVNQGRPDFWEGCKEIVIN